MNNVILMILEIALAMAITELLVTSFLNLKKAIIKYKIEKKKLKHYENLYGKNDRFY